MAVLMAGIDHNRAGLDIRSIFSFTKKKMEEAYGCFKEMKQIRGSVIISTCNRMEFWISTKGEDAPDPLDILCGYLHLAPEEYREFFVIRSGEDATDHLFRVASGLESRIIGEDQIITQVGEAVAYARSCYATDHTLEVLFRTAVTAGKRVKTETVLSTADQSVIHTALDNLESEGIYVKGRTCMVIGNGMMGKLSAQALMDHGADVTVTIRQYHKGIVDTPEGVHRINYEDKLKMFPKCDFVISATSSPNYTLRYEELAALPMDHPVRLIDLAVPRDIEPQIESLSWATLYDVDSFNIDLESENLRKNLKKAEAILEEEKAEFYDWYKAQDVAPRIAQIKSAAGEDVTARLKPLYKKMKLADEERELIRAEAEGASERMMNKLLYGMREKMSEHAYMSMLRAMEEVLK